MAVDRVCPFCKKIHSVDSPYLNTICGCGGKYYSNAGYWLNRTTGEEVKGLKSECGDHMTEEEALSLIDRCSEIMSGYLGMPCTVTKEWMHQECLLEIRYDSGSRVFWSMSRNAVADIVYWGYYDFLVDEVGKIKKCLDDNRDIFNKLMWMYEHERELGFCRSFRFIKGSNVIEMSAGKWMEEKTE